MNNQKNQTLKHENRRGIRNRRIEREDKNKRKRNEETNFKKGKGTTIQTPEQE